MRKRTNWAADVTGAVPTGSGNSAGGSASGLHTGGGNSWSGTGTNSGFGTNTNTSTTAGNSVTGLNDDGRSQSWGNKPVDTGFDIPTGGYIPNKIKPRRNADMQSLLPVLGKIVIGIVAVIAVICIIQAIIGNAPAAMNAVSTTVNEFIFAVMMILIMATVIWVFLLAILGKFLPGKLKAISFIVILAITVVGYLVPELGCALGVLALIFFAIVILFYLMVKP